jgi:hypothetical protein
MTGTLSCDHAAMDAIARAWQRAAVSGAQLRLVVTAEVAEEQLSAALDELDETIHEIRHYAFGGGEGPRPPS